MTNILSCVCLYDQVKKYENSILESMKNQSIPTDILIVDDYDEYTLDNDNPRYRIYKNHEKSISEIREFCIKYALENEYEYIAFFDSDDIYCKKRLELCIKKMEDEHSDICVHNMTVVDENEEIIRESFFDINFNYLDKIEKNILKFNFIGLGNSVYKVKKMKNMPKCPNHLIYDWWLAIHLIYINKCRCLISFETLSQYRQYGNNLANIVTIDKDNIYKEYIIKLGLYYQLLLEDNINIEKNDIIKLIQNISLNYQKCNITTNSNQCCWWNYLNEEEK